MGLQSLTGDRHHTGLTEPVAAFFEKQGARMLGVADNSFVFQDPVDNTKVLKLSLAPQDGWRTWANWAMQVRAGAPQIGYDPRHLPVIFEHHRVGSMTVARMEKLEAVPKFHPARAKMRENKRDPRRLAFALKDAGEPRAVTELLLRAHTIFPDAHWDLGPTNWMKRPDGTLVLNDPISHMRQLGNP